MTLINFAKKEVFSLLSLVKADHLAKVLVNISKDVGALGFQKLSDFFV